MGQRAASIEPFRRASIRGPLLGLLALAILIAGPATEARANGGGAVKQDPNAYAIAMFTLAHPAGLQKFAKRVSSPNSRHYQRYRPVAWIVRRFGAKPKVKRQAVAWFGSAA